MKEVYNNWLQQYKALHV